MCAPGALRPGRARPATHPTLLSRVAGRQCWKGPHGRLSKWPAPALLGEWMGTLLGSLQGPPSLDPSACYNVLPAERPLVVPSSCHPGIPLAPPQPLSPLPTGHCLNRGTHRQGAPSRPSASAEASGGSESRLGTRQLSDRFALGSALGLGSAVPCSAQLTTEASCALGRPLNPWPVTL